MHDRNVFHQTLSDQSNYFVCSENIKIIQFVEGGDSVNKFVWNDKKLGDLIKKLQRLVGFSFDVERLLGRDGVIPQLLQFTCRLSKVVISRIYHEYNSNPKGSRSHQMLEWALHDQSLVSKHISGPLDWLPTQMSEVLTKFYNYRQRKPYKLNKLKHLLRFYRNLFKHYHEHIGDLEKIDREIRKLWPQIIHRLHEQKVKF